MTDLATEYAERVASGEGVYGRLHRLACERHLRDLERQGTAEFPYTWDVGASEDIIDYGNSLTVLEGFKRKRVELQDCQAFDLGCTFGWKDARGFRRFRRRYKSMSRQQGKSFENGIMGTNIAAFGGYQYGQLYTAATKKRQARIVWAEMKKFIEADPDLAEWFDIKEYKYLITALNTNCTIEALSKESGLDDGFRPIFASLDELHQMKNNATFKALYNGTRDLDETLISMITTRGFDTESFAFEMDSFAINVLEGVVTAEDFFADIYALDEGDNPFDPSVWVKSSPRLAAKSEGIKRMQADADTARAMGGEELRDFMTKSLNMWVMDAETKFVLPEDWKRAGCGLTLDDFRGQRCWVGIDLSSGGDLTSIAIEFDYGDEGVYVYSHSFMPRGRLTEHIRSDLAPYDLWERNGLITVTGGETDFRNDYHFIVKHIKELADEYELDIVAFGYDTHNAEAFTVDLEEFGVPLIKVVQSAKSLNDSTEDVRLLVKSGKYAYDRANELLSWSFANAVLVSNSFGEVKIDKNAKRYKRIDPADACIDARFAHIAWRDSQTVDVDAEMQRYLETMGWS